MIAANNQQWVQQVETITNANQSEQAALREIIAANQQEREQEREAVHHIIDRNIRETVSLVIDIIIHQIEK